MSSLGGFGVPGQGTLEITTESELLWGGDRGKGMALYSNAVISGAARDAGNTSTTVLRSGLLLGKVTASGEYEEWDADASDGTETLEGVLDLEIRAQDFNATNADRVVRVLRSGPIKASSLLIQGTAFNSSTDEHLARRLMVAAGFVFDDDVFGYKAGAPRSATVTGTSDTLTEDENGSTIFYSSASAVAVTLPTIRPGLVYDLVRTANEELVVSSAAGDDMIVGNDVAADSVTFTTAGQQIGARIRISSHYVGGTLKWLVELPNMPFGTGLTGGFTYAIAS